MPSVINKRAVYARPPFHRVFGDEFGRDLRQRRPVTWPWGVFLGSVPIPTAGGSHSLVRLLAVL